MDSLRSSLGTASAASVLPHGTVTFMFTDIEGSTQRWDEFPAAMQEALRRHDELVRIAIEAQGGCVFKTIGDAFCAAFSRAQDALVAAHHAQRALATHDFSAVDELRVRIALHTGTADERDGDYFGASVNRVSRLVDIAHGGQVLVSGTAAELLGDGMPPGFGLRDLGEHRLKDLAQPEHVHQLVAPELPHIFPALRSVDAFPNNLPRRLTSFVGREDVVAHLTALLLRSPLVTLVGTGGAGKTRCAVHVAGDLLDESSDGVWFVELAPVSDPALVANSIAKALGLQESRNRPDLDTLTTYLRKKRLLLVLDNCEHVIDGAGAVAATILRTCPNVRILATSRERLNVAGESVYRMPSLGLPPQAGNLTASAALQHGAVALFADRALAVDTRFALSDENAPIVAEICRRLDGIPLAIELAAARAKVLAPRQLAAKLDERFRLLTGGDRGALARHQTMRALIDWSYDLLSSEQRALFRRLSVFAGGFTLDAAGLVGADSAASGSDVLDPLSSLVEKSLVVAELDNRDSRYRMLESTNAYAREKLVESGEQEAVARAHAAAFLDIAERLDRAWDTMTEREWLAQVEPEMDNWRAALEWTLVARGDVTTGMRVATALGKMWNRLGVPEGARWLRIASDAVDASTPQTVVAKLELAQATLYAGLSQFKAGEMSIERSLARWLVLGDARGIAEARRVAGYIRISLGRIAEGELLLHEALLGFRSLGARKRVGDVLHDLAMARQYSDDIAAVRAYSAEALAIFSTTGAERAAAHVANSLAEGEFRAGDARTALRLGGDALAAFRGLDETRCVAHVLLNMAAYSAKLQRFDDSRVHAREALTIARDMQLEVAVAYALLHLVAVASLRESDAERRDRPGRARGARLLGYVNGCLSQLVAEPEYTERQAYDTSLAALRAALGPATCATLMGEGRAWSEDSAVAEALCI